jgi:hypothetical protein
VTLCLTNANTLTSVQHCSQEDANAPTEDSNKLDLANVGGVFVVLIAGTFAAFLMAVLELLWNCRKIAVQEKVLQMRPIIWNSLANTCVIVQLHYMEPGVRRRTSLIAEVRYLILRTGLHRHGSLLETSTTSSVIVSVLCMLYHTFYHDFVFYLPLKSLEPVKPKCPRGIIGSSFS